MFRELTGKQKQVLKKLIEHKSFHDTPEGNQLDLDQLLEAVDYKVSKQAFQFTLRGLRKRGFIEKSEETYLRRGHSRVLWHLTESGAKHFRRLDVA